MTPDLWMVVLTAVSVGAAVFSAVYAKRANSVSQEIAEADLVTDIAVRPVENPHQSGQQPIWPWMLTNVSRTGIVHVRVRHANRPEQLDRECDWVAIIRPASPDHPSYTGTELDWGAAALMPFETGYFRLPMEACPSGSQCTYLRVSWTEIRAEQKPRCRTFRIFLKEHNASSEPCYGMENVG